MNIRKNIMAMVAGASLLFGACGDYLDITPKGATTLSNLTDLEYMLNGAYTNSAYEFPYLTLLTNEACCAKGDDPSLTISEANTLEYAYLSYDEEFDRYAFTANDNIYETYYSNINRLNIFLGRLAEVDGDEDTKIRLEAEARVLRAYWHYLLVNMYAKQYDEATAETEGGIPYVTDTEVENVKEKLTVAEVYRHLLEDCSDEVLEALPDEPVNVSRPGKAMGYAVRAKIYFQMKQYDLALEDVNVALQYNGNIDNRLPVMTEHLYERDYEKFPSIIFFAGFQNGPMWYITSPETSTLFEEGDILMNYGQCALTGSGDLSLWSQTLAEQIVQIEIGGDIYAWYGTEYKLPMGGILSDQLYYIKAECLIRAGQYQAGLDEVNKVREYRIDPAVYQPLTADNEADAMKKMQDAKWIECLFTYNNYFDLKRWNSEEAYRRTITRTIAGTTYSLSPDSPLWVMPFPPTAVRHNSTLTQNYE